MDHQHFSAPIPGAITPDVTARQLPRIDAFHVAQAKKLLADIELMDFADDYAPYALIGRTEHVLAALVEIIEGGGQR